MPNTDLIERELSIRQDLKNRYELYAARCLKIRTKQPVIINGRKEKVAPFIFNTAQTYLHQRLEEQKEKTGKVRALILKGRQQGCSTYVGGRYYHKTSHRRGVRTFILAHMDDATNNLFNMVKRFHTNVPDLMRPHTSFSNRKELVFDVLDSSYGLGTAGSPNIGRSDTIDFFHGSEVAFWEHTDEIKTGAMQAAEMAEEIILESTANGLGNMFHAMWQDAETGRSEYAAIFIPWYWQEEYQRIPPVDFELSREEHAYKAAYTLNNAQIYWRRLKIIELGSPALFKQEYPGNAAEAFQNTGVNSLIAPETVLKSRKTMDVERYGAYVVGCDPAREGDDATTFIRRQGRRAWGLESHLHLDDMAKTGIAKKVLDEEPVDRMFIDRGGGSGMYDRLVEMGYGKRVTLVNFGSKALDPDKYKNRRSEMWDTARAWLESDEDTQIPDKDSLQADLTNVGFKYTSTTQLQLEPKEDVKKRIGKSPDEGDAFCLTFAEPVRITFSKSRSVKRSRRRRTGMAA